MTAENGAKQELNTQPTRNIQAQLLNVYGNILAGLPAAAERTISNSGVLNFTGRVFNFVRGTLFKNNTAVDAAALNVTPSLIEQQIINVDIGSLVETGNQAAANLQPEVSVVRLKEILDVQLKVKAARTGNHTFSPELNRKLDYMNELARQTLAEADGEQKRRLATNLLAVEVNSQRGNYTEQPTGLRGIVARVLAGPNPTELKPSGTSPIQIRTYDNAYRGVSVEPEALADLKAAKLVRKSRILGMPEPRTRSKVETNSKKLNAKLKADLAVIDLKGKLADEAQKREQVTVLDRLQQYAGDKSQEQAEDNKQEPLAAAVQPAIKDEATRMIESHTKRVKVELPQRITSVAANLYPERAPSARVRAEFLNALSEDFSYVQRINWLKSACYQTIMEGQFRRLQMGTISEADLYEFRAQLTSEDDLARLEFGAKFMQQKVAEEEAAMLPVYQERVIGYQNQLMELGKYSFEHTGHFISAIRHETNLDNLIEGAELLRRKLAEEYRKKIYNFTNPVAGLNCNGAHKTAQDLADKYSKETDIEKLKAGINEAHENFEHALQQAFATQYVN